MATFQQAHEGIEVCSVQFTRNGKYILSSGRDSMAKLWELSTVRCLVAYTGAGATGKQVSPLMTFLGLRPLLTASSPYTGAPRPGSIQPQRGLRHVPGRGDHVALLLGLSERLAQAAPLPRPQRRRPTHRALPVDAGIPHVLGRFQSAILVQEKRVERAKPKKVSRTSTTSIHMLPCIRNRYQTVHYLTTYAADLEY